MSTEPDTYSQRRAAALSEAYNTFKQRRVEFIKQRHTYKNVSVEVDVEQYLEECAMDPERCWINDVFAIAELTEEDYTKTKMDWFHRGQMIYAAQCFVKLQSYPPSLPF